MQSGVTAAQNYVTGHAILMELAVHVQTCNSHTPSPAFAKQLFHPENHSAIHNHIALSVWLPLQCKHRPSWFRALAWSEVIAQLPFFFVGLYGFSFCKEWIRTPALVYGLCTATTLLPILGELILTDNTEFNKGVLLGFYLPYLIMPLSIALRCLSRQQLFLPPTKDVNKWL